MEIQIVIFLAFTSVTLVFNSMVVWFAYKAFANVTTRMTETIRDLQHSETTRSWLTALESASHQAVTVTETVRDQVAGFDPVLARAESQFGFGLAKMDVRIERFYDSICHRAEAFQGALWRPVRGIGATLAGVREVLVSLSARRNGDGASSMRTE